MSLKRLLFLALLVFVPLACDFPTESDEETQVTTTEAVVSASEAGTVSAFTLSAAASKVQIGETTTLTYTVTYTRADTSEPLPTQFGLTTSLGNFGNAAGGPTSITPALSFPSGCTSCSFTGQQSFYAGTTTGNANLVASLGSSTAQATVTVADATALFINSLSPGFGAASGGTRVVIVGQGFTTSPLPRVSFGGVLAELVSSTETQITVNAPQSPSPVSTGSSLVVDVTVDVPATDVTVAQTDTLKGSFTYTAGGGAVPRLPSILRIQARSTGTNAGENAGGYAVDIFGSNFENQVTLKIGSGTSVSDFNGVTVSGVSVVNAGQITIASMPPATPDQLNTSVDILLTNQLSGLSVVAQSGFSYQSPDVVVDIEPSSIVYYQASSTAATVKVRGLDVATGATTLDTSRYTLEFGGETQCGTCGLSESSGTFTITVPATGTGLVEVTPTNCTAQSGAVTLTDRQTTETASGATFTYDVEKPTITALGGTTSSPASGGGTLQITGAFSTNELATAQVLINGQSASFAASGCSAGPSPSSCTLNVTIPAFTGTFDTASCTSGSQTGTQEQDKKVDIEVLYQSTSCNITRSQAFTYEPLSDECVVSTDPPTANFSSQVLASDNLMVQFIDQSTGATSIDWFFGDGTSQSCTESELPCDVTHTYTGAGIYTVTQRATNSAGSNSLNQTVIAGEAPGASISGPSAGTTGVEVTFTNTSTGIDSDTSCQWSWGDGSNPDLVCGESLTSPLILGHTFTAAGTYTILLQVTNGLGNDSATAEITISDP